MRSTAIIEACLAIYACAALAAIIGGSWRWWQYGRLIRRTMQNEHKRQQAFHIWQQSMEQCSGVTLEQEEAEHLYQLESGYDVMLDGQMQILLELRRMYMVGQWPEYLAGSTQDGLQEETSHDAPLE